MPKSAPVVRAPTSINIDRAVWKEFKVACANKDCTVTEQLERLIRNHLNTHRVRITPQSKRTN